MRAKKLGDSPSQLWIFFYFWIFPTSVQRACIGMGTQRDQDAITRRSNAVAPWRRHEVDETNKGAKSQAKSSLASLARTAVIQKFVMLPKLKATAFFQPEDHVKKHKMDKNLQKKTKSSAVRSASVTAVHKGGIFMSGNNRSRNIVARLRSPPRRILVFNLAPPLTLSLVQLKT